MKDYFVTPKSSELVLLKSSVYGLLYFQVEEGGAAETWGGEVPNLQLVSSIDRYDVARDEWVTAGHSRYPRQMSSVAVVSPVRLDEESSCNHSGRILIIYYILCLFDIIMKSRIFKFYNFERKKKFMIEKCSSEYSVAFDTQ